jgi:hypothetical protein
VPGRSLCGHVPSLLADVAGRHPLELFDHALKMERILEAALVGDFGNAQTGLPEHGDATFRAEFPQEAGRSGMMAFLKLADQRVARD